MISTIMKNIISNTLKDVKDEPVALLLSKGIDSHALLFELIEQGKNIVIYSFTLEDRESSDFKGARETAKLYGLPFFPIYLPVDIDILKHDLLYLIQEKGLTKKTEIECTWVLNHALKLIKEKVVVAGLGADGHFVLSKKGCIHFKHSIELMDIYRSKLFSNPNYAQQEILKILANERGKVVLLPYLQTEMINLFKGTSWDELNKPKQKQAILDMFPNEFEKMKVYQHSNFQLSDSGISEHFTKLMNTDWRKGKSVTSIYNAIQRKELGCDDPKSRE
jgi:asparagine synthetase B (glutamine-hydrolysing)